MKNCFIGKSKSNDENINNLFEEMETLILLKTYGQYYFIKRAVKKIFYNTDPTLHLPGQYFIFRG